MKEKIKHLIEVFDIKKFIKFGLIGVLNTLVDFVVFYLMNKLIGDGPTVVALGMTLVLGPYISNFVSYVIANIHSFIWNKFWTFKKRQRITRQEAIRYIITSIGYVAVSTVCLAVFMNFFRAIPLPAWLSADNIPLLAKIPTAGITIFYNYLMNKFWVFK